MENLRAENSVNLENLNVALAGAGDTNAGAARAETAAAAANLGNLNGDLNSAENALNNAENAALAGNSNAISSVAKKAENADKKDISLPLIIRAYSVDEPQIEIFRESKFIYPKNEP